MLPGGNNCEHCLFFLEQQPTCLRDIETSPGQDACLLYQQEAGTEIVEFPEEGTA